MCPLSIVCTICVCREKMTINLVKHGKEMLDAYEKMLKGGTDHWFLLDYEPGNSHVLKLGDQGEDGLEEMASAFNSGRLQYGMATVKVAGSSQPKVLLVQWQGEGVKTSLLAPTANHVREVKLFFKGVHVVIHARNEDDVEASTLRQAVQRLPGASNGDKNQGHSDLPPTGPVHSVYERVRPGQDPALKSDRESFWKGVQMEEETRQSNERERMQLRDEAVKKDRDQLTQQIHQRQEENNTTTAINKKMDKGVQREGETRLSNERHRMQLRDEVVKTEIHQRQEGNNPTMTINKKMDNIPHHPVKNTYSPSPLPPPSQSIIDHNRDIPFESEHSPVIESEQLDEPVQVEHDLIHKPTENNGSSLRAVALWDYAASDETEISFDPDDVITEIEMVDDGWWRGRGPDGHIGLFPANFVQLN